VHRKIFTEKYYCLSRFIILLIFSYDHLFARIEISKERPADIYHFCPFVYRDTRQRICDRDKIVKTQTLWNNDKTQNIETSSEIGDSATLVNARPLRDIRDCLAIAAARRTGTTACPVDLAAINPAGPRRWSKIISARPSAAHYTLHARVRELQNATARSISSYPMSISLGPNGAVFKSDLMHKTGDAVKKKK
jgi:hypothetical protein